MIRIAVYFLSIALLFSSCNFINKIKEKLKSQQKIEIVKSEEQIAEEIKAKEDSIKNAEFEQVQKNALGDLTFGMSKDLIQQENKTSEKLGNHTYNLNYAYNGDNQLYSLKLKSYSNKAINYDTSLKSSYHNLRKIIKLKYGEPKSSKPYPSIFDVQKKGTYWIDSWEIGRKQIKLGLKENSLNSYSTVCQITDKNMEELENERQYKLKNKDVIEAAEKF